MKTIAYTALHYGRDYLASAIRSVIDSVDEYWVLYSAHGSHGSQTPLPCPDSRIALYDIAFKAAGKKLHWIDGNWRYENEQRESIYGYAPDADVILVLDSDEVWSDALIKIINDKTIIEYWMMHGYRTVRAPMIHYWRSFYRCVLHDPAYPVRIIFPRNHGQDEPTINHAHINHFGYAQRSEIVYYKQHTHGHKGEWRKDIDWYTERFMANAQFDCHPVGSEYWNPEAVNPTDYLPAWMMQHPYAHRELIE